MLFPELWNSNCCQPRSKWNNDSNHECIWESATGGKLKSSVYSGSPFELLFLWDKLNSSRRRHEESSNISRINECVTGKERKRNDDWGCLVSLARPGFNSKITRGLSHWKTILSWSWDRRVCYKTTSKWAQRSEKNGESGVSI